MNKKSTPMDEQQIFLEALQRETPEEIRAFLAEACAEDTDLLKSVEMLLDAKHQAGDFLQVIPTNAMTIVQNPIGTMIGPYKLREQIGEGGMGIVYLAEQTEPVKRKVALKIIKPGMDTKEVITRFQAEHQALALMDHQHIAKVLDAGTTESGLPYFVMELVRGIPITQYCDQAQVSTEKRLELFIQVCKAVQHAHQKGIIHRDIKPSNVLITIMEDGPMPKVIDFGVAKAINQRLTEQTFYTAHAQMIGTPLYMSPEQAEMTGFDIDTRTDIYSLGVLLYELLTGETPFDRDSMKQAGYDEMRRMIREDEPPRPSARVSTLKIQALSTLSSNRSVDARKYSVSLKGELDWIVMRALEKDRNRRYESASSFAADIERYLKDEPVEACPPSKAYRLQKFTKRNKVFLTTAAIVLIALVAGTGIASWQAVVANEERAQAQESKAKAEQEAAISKAVLDFVQEDLLGKASPNETPDPEVKLRTILDRAAAEIKDKFPGQPLVEATLLDTIGQAYQTLGKYKEAETHQQRAVELSRKERGTDDPQTLGYSSRLGRVLLDRGRYKDAYEILDKTFNSQQQTIGNEDQDTLVTMRHLGGALRLLGKYKEAEDFSRQALDISRRTLGEEHSDTIRSMNNLAGVYQTAGRYNEAEELYLKTLEIRKRTVGEEHPDTLASRHDIATLLHRQGQYDKAEKRHLQTLELRKRMLGEEHPDTLNTMMSLASVYYAQGDNEKAEELHLQALENKKRTLGEEHPHTLTSRLNLANVYSAQARFVEAEKLRLQTLEIRKRTLGIEHPDTLESMNNLARGWHQQGRLDEEEKLLRETLGISKRTLGEEHPLTLLIMGNLASSYGRQGHLDKAETLHLKLLEILGRTLGEDHPQTLSIMNDLANVYESQKRYSDAEKLHLKALVVLKQNLGEENPQTIITRMNLAATYCGQKKYEQAEELILRTLEIQKSTMGKDHPHTLVSMIILANVYRDQKKYEPAEDLYLRTLEIQKRSMGNNHPQSLISMDNLAHLYYDLKRYNESEKLYLQIIELTKGTAAEKHPITLKSINNLGIVYTNWTWRLSTDANPKDRDAKKALAVARKAIEISATSNNWNNLGIALYRNGEFRESVEALEKADKLLKGKDRQHRPFLVMSHWQLGNKETANRYYQQYIDWFLSKNPSGNDQRFLAETETLLGYATEDRQQHADEYQETLINQTKEKKEPAPQEN